MRWQREPGTIDQETTLSDSTVRLSLDQILAIVGKQTVELEMAKAQIAALQEQIAKLEEASKPVDPKKAE